jgi:hypothetical protein
MTQGGRGKQDDDSWAMRRNRGEAISRAGSFANRAFVRAGFADPTLVLRWAEIVGPDVARISQPLKLSEGPTGGTLTLKTEAAAAVFLQHQSRGLCERINAYLGRNAVTRLRFVSGTLPSRPLPARQVVPPSEPPPDDPVNRFGGPEALKDALARLARVRIKPDTPD